MSPNDADGMANSVDPDLGSSLIWVCTVCPGISVHKLRNVTVFQTEGEVRILLYNQTKSKNSIQKSKNIHVLGQP